MRRGWSVISVAAVVSLSACATAPTGPSVMVLPGTGKPASKRKINREAEIEKWRGIIDP